VQRVFGSGIGCFFSEKSPYRNFSIAAVAELAKKHALGLELSAHHGLRAHSSEELHELKKTLSALPSTTAHTGVFTWHPDALKTEIGICKALGLRVLVIHEAALGLVDNEYTTDIDTVLEIARTAKESGVTIVLENGEGGLENLAGLFEQINKTPDETGFGVCIDTGRATMRSPDRAEYSVADYIRRLGKYLLHVHIHDVRDDIGHYIPGTGILDWEDIGEALAQVRYENRLIFELHCETDPIEELIEAKEYVQRAFR
jgi:sugar phosphate isomerase/epimerase